MPEQRIHLVLTLSVAASLACNTLAGRAPEGDGPQPTAPDTSQDTGPDAPDFYDLEGNPVTAEPQPAEAVEAMLHQVEEGSLALEDGVLGLLRLLAGEASAPDYLDGFGAEPVFRDVFNLSMTAYDLYQTSDDPALRSELERLLRVLAPPQDALNRYAAPADTSLSSGAGRKGLGRQIDCSQIWHEGFPESQGPAPTCLLYDSFSAGGYEFWVYFPIDMAGDDAAMAYVQGAYEALADSQATYSQLVEVRSIDIVFSLLSASAIDGPQDGVAMVPAVDPGELGSRACPITVFSGAKSVPVANFKQLIAHEVFHCIHLWRKGVSGDPALSWYNEGMAHYFSNVVYPSVNHEHKSVGHFHAQSPTHSIFDMTYENTVFFQYLGNRFGDAWLIDLLDGMPTAGQGAMMSYLAGLEGMDQVFHDFGRAYLEGRINDTGGGALPGKPLVLPEDNVNFPDPGKHRLEARPFHVERARYLFDSERQYDLALDLQGDGALDAAMLLPQSDWTSLPALVVACPSGPSYIHLLTSTAPGGASSSAASFDVSVANAEETECDECLVGVWEHFIASSDYWDAVMAATADRATQLDSVGGRQVLTFHASGLYESLTEDWEVVWISEGVGGNVTQVRTVVQASAVGSYASIGGSLLQLTAEDSDFRQETVTVVSGPLGTFSSDPDVKTEGSGYLPSVAEGTPYTCSPTTLSYFTEAPDWNWSGYVTYERISSDPSAPAE
jgi:hypothetical protein